VARVVTHGSALSVRAGAGLDYPIVGYRNNGDTVEIDERRHGWCRIGAGQWISGDYVQGGDSLPDPDTEDAVIPHPRRPTDRHWRLLIGFASGSATLRESHREWLRSFAASQARSGQHVWIRGMASHLGRSDANQELSERRAAAVRDYLVNRCRVPPGQITGIPGIGEGWAQGSETEDDARSRAVEVIITNDVTQLPGSFIRGRPAVSRNFWIKYMGHGSGGEGLAGDVVLFVMHDDHDNWQRYFYTGGGVGAGSPISWGEGLPRGTGWVRFTTALPAGVESFGGRAELTQAGAQVGSVGLGAFILDFDHRTLNIPTGPGFSLGASGTTGALSTAGPPEQNNRWRHF
jgi:outer membrane protein OmpA-like peptidoglycan-associated protein